MQKIAGNKNILKLKKKVAQGQHCVLVTIQKQERKDTNRVRKHDNYSKHIKKQSNITKNTTMIVIKDGVRNYEH